jgi:ATP-dependent RNA helicase RhlE
VAVVYGGVGKGDQIDWLHRGVDILVATPGRLLDLMEQQKLVLGRTEILVLDEADRMLDMGFIPDIKRIVMALPLKRQSMLFSATMPPMIVGLAANILTEPHNIEITSSVRNDPRIEQKVLFVRQNKKNDLLLRLLSDRTMSRTLVFTRTKHRADTLARTLTKKKVRANALHGDKTQSERTRALDSFHKEQIQVLVATDLASRGLDVDDIDHVINYELPQKPEVYIHRIGRTARAGKQGIALSFCDRSEVLYLRQIEKVLKKQIPVWENHPFHSPEEGGAGRSSRSHSSGPKSRKGTPEGAAFSRGSRKSSRSRKKRPRSGGSTRRENSSARKASSNYAGGR